MLSEPLKEQLARLSPQEKLEVFETIRSTVFPQSESSFSELSQNQERELLRRARQAGAKPGTGRTWAEVKRRILGS